jgi:hypothetical protein
MDRQRLLRRMEKAWRALQDSYAGLSDSEMMESGVTKAWSVRDILVHVTSWEQETLKHLPLILKGGRPPLYSAAYGGIHAFNAQVTARKKDLSLSEVLREQSSAHSQVVALVESIPEDTICNDTRFVRRLRLDTYGHYPKHAEAIQNWRLQRSLGRRAHKNTQSYGLLR